MFDTMFSQSQQFWTGWSKLWQEQLAQLTSTQEQSAALLQQGAEHTAEAIDGAATLAKASLDHFSHLGREWSRVTMDAWRRGTTLLTPEPTTPEG